MKTAQTSQTSQSESEPKQLEYRSPNLARLGKLADITLTRVIMGVTDDPTMSTKTV